MKWIKVLWITEFWDPIENWIDRDGLSTKQIAFLRKRGFHIAD